MIKKEKPLFEIKVLNDLPVILGIWHTGFRYARYGERYSSEVSSLLDSQTSPVYYILDLTRLADISIEGLVLSTNRGARGSNPNLHHAMNCGSMFVSKDILPRLAAKGMNTETFGNVDVKLFESLEEALEYVRAAVEVESQG